MNQERGIPLCIRGAFFNAELDKGSPRINTQATFNLKGSLKNS